MAIHDDTAVMFQDIIERIEQKLPKECIFLWSGRKSPNGLPYPYGVSRMAKLDNKLFDSRRGSISEFIFGLDFVPTFSIYKFETDFALYSSKIMLISDINAGWQQ